MTILTLQPGLGRLDYVLFSDGKEIHSGRLEELRPKELMHDVSAGIELDAIALRVVFGGSRFSAPAIASPGVVHELTSLVPAAPLHLPAVLDLLELFETVAPRTPVVLLFDTAFFARLPGREAGYGIETETASRLAVRRFGYHGIFHEAAIYEAQAWQGPIAGDQVKVLSICLEPQPEAVGALGGKPLYVTGGATPLEGLPGERTSGEIDPTILLDLVRERKWGPERIDQMLTHESGLFALAERPATIEEVLLCSDPALELASAQLRYRILQAAGSAAAVLGGLDVMVFSGRYARAGSRLGSWLGERLHLEGRGSAGGVPWLCFDGTLPRLMADRAAAVVRSAALPSSSPKW